MSLTAFRQQAMALREEVRLQSIYSQEYVKVADEGFESQKYVKVADEGLEAGIGGAETAVICFKAKGE